MENKISLFKQHLKEKRAVKIISGIDNFDIDKARQVVQAASIAKASAVDVCADENIIQMAIQTCELPVFVSSIDPHELIRSVEIGADAIEVGNYDALYRKGLVFDDKQILEVVKKTLNGLSKKCFVCVTVPGHLTVEKQINLAKTLQKLGVDLLQTEGSCLANVSNNSMRGLVETATVSIANTMELVNNLDNIPVMTASGLTQQTVPLAFASGASAVGVGSCINKLNTTLEMIATASNIVNITSKNYHKLILA